MTDSNILASIFRVSGVLFPGVLEWTARAKLGAGSLGSSQPDVVLCDRWISSSHSYGGTFPQ
jgi:hypothetical protein